MLYDAGRLLAEAEVVKAHLVQPHVQLSESDATRLGITDGDRVTLSRDGVTIDLPAQVNKILGQGMVVVPCNLAGHPAEKLAGASVWAELKIEKQDS